MVSLSWNNVYLATIEQKLREQKYKVTFKNRIKEAEYFIDKINKTHNAIKTELKQDKITNKYKNLVEEDMEGWVIKPILFTKNYFLI